MTITEAKQEVRTFIETELGVTTIFQNQNANRPSLPYVTVLASSSARVGEPDRIPPTEDHGEIVRQHRTFMCSIQYHGENAVEHLESLQMKFRESFKFDGGVTLLDDEDIADVAEVFDRRFEPRALYDARFAYTLETENEDVTYIEDVQYEFKESEE